MSKKLEIFLISILVFVFPYMKIKLGVTPIYFIDVLYIYLIFKYGFKKRVFTEQKAIIFFIFFSFLSFLVEFISHFSIISVYFLLRFTLPFYAFFYFSKNINNPKEVQFILKTIFLTAIINSSFVILYSFSFTRSIIDLFYSNEFFYPQKERFSSRYLSDISQRGVTLAGGANSTSFLCLIGLAVFHFLKSNKIRFKSFFFNNEIIGMVMFLFFSAASLLSLSRAAFITLFFILIYFFKNKSVRFGIIFFIIISPVILLKTNVLQYVDYSRIINSVEIVKGEADYGKSENERIDAYTKPFKLLIQYPIMFVIGKGLSNDKVSETHKYGYYQQELKGRHGLLGAISYDRGFIAFLFFIFFILTLYRKTFFNNMSQYNFLNKAILIIIFMPLITTHIFIDTISGVYQFTFLSALIISLNKNPFLKTI